MVSTPPPQTALVTGASSGIGLGFARELARQKQNLVLVARNEAKLRELADELEAAHGIEAAVLPADLAEPDAPARLVSELDRRGLHVDVLINNAGLGAFGHFTELPLETDLSMLQVNVVALTALTKLLAPKMVARSFGRILNVASTAAFQPGPLLAVYYASKAYVLSFSEALANELAESNVTVTALCPGPTRSEFFSRANMEDSGLVKGKVLMEVEDVVKAGLDGLSRGKRVVIPGVRNKLLATSVKFAPRRLVTNVVRKIQERSHGG